MAAKIGIFSQTTKDLASFFAFDKKTKVSLPFPATTPLPISVSFQRNYYLPTYSKLPAFFSIRGLSFTSFTLKPQSLPFCFALALAPA